MDIEDNITCNSSNSSDVETDNPMANDQIPNRDTPPRIPPIFIQSSDWRKVANKLMSTFPEASLTAKTHTGSGLKLQCADVTGFRIVQRYLTQQGIDFHTLPLPEERLLKVIIKGLPIDIAENEISEELLSIGYEVKSVRQFQNSAKKFPIHLITLSSSPSNKLIFNESSLFYIQIKVESYRSSKPAQCYSCQRFGHSSLHCGYAPRCVKCSGPHLAKDCPKPRDEDPKCTNCSGNHTANYGKCPALVAEIQSRRPTRPYTSNFPAINSSNYPVQHLTTQAPPATSMQPTTTASVPTNSYATVTAGHSLNPIPDIAQVINRLNELTANLTKSGGNVKQTLIALLSILPLLLSIHGQN